MFYHDSCGIGFGGRHLEKGPRMGANQSVSQNRQQMANNKRISESPTKAAMDQTLK
jgi:hypothetical protein